MELLQPRPDKVIPSTLNDLRQINKSRKVVHMHASTSPFQLSPEPSIENFSSSKLNIRINIRDPSAMESSMSGMHDSSQLNLINYKRRLPSLTENAG